MPVLPMTGVELQSRCHCKPNQPAKSTSNRTRVYGRVPLLRPPYTPRLVDRLEVEGVCTRAVQLYEVQLNSDLQCRCSSVWSFHENLHVTIESAVISRRLRGWREGDASLRRRGRVITGFLDCSGGLAWGFTRKDTPTPESSIREAMRSQTEEEKDDSTTP
ncbi:hypothetical protein BD310DRAFT_919949, partial [Dichomitus squalens]